MSRFNKNAFTRTGALAIALLIAALVIVPSWSDDDHDATGDSLASASSSPTEDVSLAPADGRAEESASESEASDGLSQVEPAAGGHSHGPTGPGTDDGVTRGVGAAAGSGGASSNGDEPTPAEAAAAVAAAAKQRDEPDPELVPVAAGPRTVTDPDDRYAMAGGCYAIQDIDSGKFLARNAATATVTANDLAAAEPFHFRATDLGMYLLYGTQEDFLSGTGPLTPLKDAAPGWERIPGVAALETNGVPDIDDVAGMLAPDDAVAFTDLPSPSADFEVDETDLEFTFVLPEAGVALAAVDGTVQLVDAASAGTFALIPTTGCAIWPEINTNISGPTVGGASPLAETRGYVDAHTHGMAFEFLGGEAHCGRPWHRYGVEYALRDCEDHELADGNGAVLENFLHSGAPNGSHDPVGWPTFADWPAPDSLTHEGTYYKWLERAYRGGLRVFVNLLVENNKLCEVYPLKRNSCDDMDSVRLQAQNMYELQDYIDAQSGGPGEGWYRIVTDPFQAREVINDGKLAVVMGIETSVVFGCTMKLGVPQCDEASISEQLDEVHDLGVRQMELVNKFDNALSGVAGDGGPIGVLINGANFLETGQFWQMNRCENEEDTDNGQLNLADDALSQFPEGMPGRDALFGAVAELFVPGGIAPVYGSRSHCNQMGLTDLGAYTIEQMADRGMLFDPDHMSVVARSQALDLVEEMDYPGVLSSHSWSTPDAYRRIYKLGGLITPYAGGSEGFVNKWRQHLEWINDDFYFGFGYGADINGFGAQGGPRGAEIDNPVTYPFKGFGGTTVHQNISGERIYDINLDGVAHYGLYPDWVEDLRRIGGDDIVADMERGAEAYLLMWERALGITNDACRQTSLLRPIAEFRDLDKGLTPGEVLAAVGQPNRRDASSYTYCAQGPGNSGQRQVTVTFADGKLRSVA